MHERKNILELQNMLRRISQMEHRLPLVNPSGVYDETTREAVRLFQTEAGLPPTGEVDYATWNAILACYRGCESCMTPDVPIYPFPGRGYRTFPGEKSPVVLIIQIILDAISTTYDAFYDVRPTGIYDQNTQDAVSEFQKINRLPETGVVNDETWDALAESYNTYDGNTSYQS